MKNSISFAVVLDDRSTMKDGRHPVKARITLNRQPRRFGLPFVHPASPTTPPELSFVASATKEEFAQIMAAKSGRPAAIRKAWERELDQYKLFVEEVGADKFTFEHLNPKADFYKKAEVKESPIKGLISALELKRKTTSKPGTASYYRDCISAVRRFEFARKKGFAGPYPTAKGSKGEKPWDREVQEIPFEVVTADWLKLFIEKSGMSKGGGTAAALRGIRAAWNEAESAGLVSRENYPFRSQAGSKGTAIPRGKSRKTAITREQVRRLEGYTPATTTEEIALNLWLFSFFANGMNMADIIQLKVADLQGDSFEFTREKTKDSSGERVTVKITPVLRVLMGKLHTPNPEGMFLDTSVIASSRPSTQAGKSADLKKDELKRAIVGKVTKAIKQVAANVGINQPVNFYSARHSFAMTLYRGGVNLNVIAALLGHRSIETTVKYLGSITQEEITDAYEALL